MKTEKHAEIKCPQCGYVQKAKIIKTFPFYTYIHYCEKCNYVITESDWDEIKKNVHEGTATLCDTNNLIVIGFID